MTLVQKASGSAAGPSFILPSLAVALPHSSAELTVGSFRTSERTHIPWKTGSACSRPVTAAVIFIVGSWGVIWWLLQKTPSSCHLILGRMWTLASVWLLSMAFWKHCPVTWLRGNVHSWLFWPLTLPCTGYNVTWSPDSWTPAEASLLKS